MVETWRLVTSFVLVIIAFDLILGLPYVYGKEGLLKQKLSASTEFSDDVFIGVWLEKSIYGCTSWTAEQGTYSGLRLCTESQTKIIYYIVSGVIPAISLALVFMILNPRTFIGLIREGI